LGKVQSHLGRDAQSWTKVAPLPGGDFPVTGVDAVIDALCDEFLFIDRPWATRLVRCYGTDARKIYSGATSVSDLGECFGSTLFAAEVIWLMTHEFARTAEDVVWRRTKLGLHLNNDQIENINSWMADRLTSASIKN
jgi:glycerol-3-phosphate dehydrogenase